MEGIEPERTTDTLNPYVEFKDTDRLGGGDERLILYDNPSGAPQQETDTNIPPVEPAESAFAQYREGAPSKSIFDKFKDGVVSVLSKIKDFFAWLLPSNPGRSIRESFSFERTGSVAKDILNGIWGVIKGIGYCILTVIRFIISFIIACIIVALLLAVFIILLALSIVSPILIPALLIVGGVIGGIVFFTYWLFKKIVS